MNGGDTLVSGQHYIADPIADVGKRVGEALRESHARMRADFNKRGGLEWSFTRCGGSAESKAWDEASKAYFVTNSDKPTQPARPTTPWLVLVAR